MDFIIENLGTIITIAVTVAAAVVALVRFFKSGTEKQLTKVREWLLYAVSLAEKELGGGTGKLKLRYVYDMFVVKFPWLAKIISFDRFSTIVDESLEEMNKLLATNDAVANYVVGVEEENA